MKAASNGAVETWLADHRILVEVRRLSFDTQLQRIIFPLEAPDTRESLTGLALNLIGILDSGRGWLLWLRDWDIWDTETEEIGWAMIEALTHSRLQPNASAFFFEPTENVSLKAALMVPLIFNWDAHLVNGDCMTFVTIDHDNKITISTIDQELADEIRSSQLESWLRVDEHNL